MTRIGARLGGLNAGGPDGWEIHDRARALVAAGETVCDLTIGEHDRPTDPAILDVMHRAARAGETGYADLAGSPALRAAIADRVARQSGVATGPDNVLVTAGGQAGLFAAHMLALDPGDRAALVAPYYTTYPGTIRGAGGVPVVLDAGAGTGFLPDEAALSAATEGARSLLINTPNNPTGRVYPRETLDAVARVAAARDLWLISDEVYDGQVLQGTHLSPRALPGMAARTLVVGSMSKSFAMTGSRLGWVVGPEAAIAAMTALAQVTTYGLPGYIQSAALWALTKGARIEARVAASFARRRRRALARLAGQQAARPLPSEGGMYLMLDIRATGLDGTAFAARLLERHAIAVMPGESFGGSAAGHVRIALTVDDARLDAALASLMREARDLSDRAGRAERDAVSRR